MHLPHRVRPQLLLLLLLVVPATARADLWGADLAPLSALVSQSGIELTQMAEQLKVAYDTYEEARRVAGYADEAVGAFKDFQSFSKDVFSPEQTMDNMFPEISSLRARVSGTGPWAQGTGELKSLIRICLGGSLAGCAQFRDAISLKDARNALSQTFGTSPVDAPDVTAADYEAAMGMASSSAQTARDDVARQEAHKLLTRCTGNTDKQSIASCQAAANAATILQAEQSADIADQLAEANRLQSVRIAQESADRKRELTEEAGRRAVLRAGFQDMRPVDVPVHTDGESLVLPENL